ncbi:hypothetical protein JX265_007189 [Neoarthrinium moseri]|uniref:Uncharacterized protein n=1 Tax=Neoarthrinium moseri TaxID=1658444 RepID=A0A9P9WKX0_9PEZI|nr:uncharacterized protein JN550_010087 [Neoarthrinium moseri]KAI1840696.1 hypothetical protein JX266_013103 [Neoarthrinium moseri]KAI1862750.1 hypothetical protein JN550_010087 [Neoarthrinium moseri]KAI1868366.1 hypothetical protein JX265_007189 [Neoarthrinium moseri]
MSEDRSTGSPGEIAGGIFREEWESFCEKSQKQARNNQIDAICQHISRYITHIHEGWKERIWRPSLEQRLQYYVRCIWRILHDAARYCNGQYRDRLIIEFLLIRGMGQISCFSISKEGRVEESVPLSLGSGRMMWVDVPFFVEDMTRLWVQDCARISRDQRRNLTSFLATISGTGTLDQLCGVGLIVLRDAFETQREMGSLDDESGDAEDDERTMESLRVLDLFDCARHWIMKAWDRFERLAAIEFSDFPAEVGQLGKLAKEAEIPDNGGFSVERVQFWKMRLFEFQEIQDTEPTLEQDARPPPQSRWPDV